MFSNHSYETVFFYLALYETELLAVHNKNYLV